MNPSLSAKQQEIVEAPDGAHLVVASAGSGKTRILTSRIRYLLLERNIRSRIIALTFTNKAAAEMKERLKDIPDLGERAYIGTIHSFCQSMLEAYGNLIGFSEAPSILERDSDRIALIEEVFKNNPELNQQLERCPTPSKKRGYLYRMLGKISSWKRELEDYATLCSGDWPRRYEQMMFSDYQERLARQGAIEFDDILLLAYRILSERPKVARIYQRSYRYFCVDEAQDLNAVQYAVIRLLALDSRNLLMVGDPNQAIYGFNGSSHRYMSEQFVKDFAATRWDLKDNFRSSKAVIRAANALYPDSISIQNIALAGSLEVAACENEAEEAEWIADQIQSLLQQSEIEGIEGPPTVGDIAVLARNRFIFDSLEEELQRRELPYHVRQPAGGGLESEWGHIFDLGLRILGNPENSLYLRELGKRLGLPTNHPLNLTEGILEGLAACTAALPAKWQGLFPELLTAWDALRADVNRFRSILDSLEDSLKAAARESTGDVQREEFERALGDMTHLRQLWINYTRETGPDSRSINHFRNQLAMGTLNPQAEGVGITLATIHAVKGLEYGIVFVMGMVEGVLPDYRAIQSGKEAIAEERNDTFVAVTRSKRLLFLSWPRNRLMPWDKETPAPQSRSRFLDAILENLNLSETKTAAVAEDPKS